MKKNLIYIFLFVSSAFFIIDLLNKIYYSPDDTFIYLQYARNLANGYGFSFNPGEPSYGITSPLWSLIAAIPYIFVSDGYWFAKILDLLFAVLSIIMFYKLARVFLNNHTTDEGENKLLSYFAVSVFILNTWFIRWAFTGMETSLAVLMMLVIFYCYLKEYYKTAFLLLGFFYLLRPEGVVLFAVLAVHYLFTTKNFKGFILNCFLTLIPIIPFLLYAKSAFGTFVPNTAIGKTSFNIGFAVYYGQLKRILETVAFSSIIELVLSFVFIIYVIYKKKLEENLLFLLWIAGLIVLYLVTDSDIISRYLLIIIPVFTLLAVKFIRYLNINKTTIVLVLFVIIAVQSQAVFFIFVKPHTDNFTEGINTCLKETGLWFKNNTPENSRILVNDVGVIGYYSQRYIIDAAALINNDLALNKNIMSMPLEEREVTNNILKYTQADYVIQRENEPDGNNIQYQDMELRFLFAREFPGLGISDPTPKWYKVYKVIK